MTVDTRYFKPSKRKRKANEFVFSDVVIRTESNRFKIAWEGARGDNVQYVQCQRDVTCVSEIKTSCPQFEFRAARAYARLTGLTKGNAKEKNKKTKELPGCAAPFFPSDRCFNNKAWGPQATKSKEKKKKRKRRKSKEKGEGEKEAWKEQSRASEGKRRRRRMRRRRNRERKRRRRKIRKRRRRRSRRRT